VLTQLVAGLPSVERASKGPAFTGRNFSYNSTLEVLYETSTYSSFGRNPLEQQTLYRNARALCLTGLSPGCDLCEVGALRPKTFDNDCRYFATTRSNDRVYVKLVCVVG
jgi:hypothetical protein